MEQNKQAKETEKFLEYLKSEKETFFNFLHPLHSRFKAKFNWYKRWHQYRYHHHLHLGILFAYTILALTIALILGFATDKGIQAFETSATSVPVLGRAVVPNTTGELNFNGAPYGSNVSIDNLTRQFSGYVWSDDLGWIAFSTDNPYNPVIINEVSGVVSGKAFVVNTGGVLDFNLEPYGSNVYLDNEGSFHGYAWSDDLGWVDFSGVSAVGITLTSPTAPSNVRIYDVSDRNLSDYALLVRWQEPSEFDQENFDSYIIERSTDNINYVSQGSTTSKAYFDTQVQSNIKYYYRIKTKNKTGTTSDSEIVSETPTGKFTTPPNLISGPDITINPTSVIVKWVTDREASSFVQIKEGNTFVSEQGQTEQTTSHEVKVVGLKSQSNYTLNIISTDIDGNMLVGPDNNFTTANNPSIYDFNVSNITQTSAIVNFKSTAIANFNLYYGETTDYGSTVNERSGAMTTNHSIHIDSLKPGKKYYIRVIGEDGDNNELKSDNSFETLPLPKVTNLEIQPVEDSPSATLKFNWETNIPTSSSVELKPEKGSTREMSLSKLTTKHEITIGNLADNSLYATRVYGRDQFGNLASSGTQEIKTDYDTRPPKISNIITEVDIVGIGSDSRGQAAISWETDELATSQIEYGLGSEGEYIYRTQEDTSLTNNHIVIISDLKTSTPYHFRIVSTDSSGNVQYSTINTFLTPQSNTSILDAIIDSLERAIGWLFGRNR